MLYQDEIGSSDTFWIWQDIHSIAMTYCFACRVQQVFVVFALFTTNRIDFLLVFHRMELTTGHNQLQLADKLGTRQLMQFCKFK